MSKQTTLFCHKRNTLQGLDRAAIVRSNARARSALVILQCCGRSVEMITELRDALRQRASMRESCRFSIWYTRNESAMRARFDVQRARSPFDNRPEETAWNDYVSGEWISDHR